MLATPLQKIAHALRQACYSTDAANGQVGGERKTFFVKVAELEAEVDRVRRNAVQLAGTGGGGGGAAARQRGGNEQASKDDKGGSGSHGGEDAMTESRLMHLESEMSHLIARLAAGEETARAMHQSNKAKDEAISTQKDNIETLTFEVDTAKSSLLHAEEREQAASEELRRIKFEEADLGLSVSQSVSSSTGACTINRSLITMHD